jgi:multiple antibiotic resistance protein
MTMTEILILFLALMGPTKALLVYAGLTEKMDAAQRLSIAFRAVIVASIVNFLFLWAGGAIIQAIHVQIPAIKISGGIILLIFALGLVLGWGAHDDHQEEGDIAIFPLAMPLLASPQGIVILIAFAAAARKSGLSTQPLYLALAITMGVNLVALLFGAKLLKYVPPSALKVVLKLSGILLCAMAVQLMLWGFSDLGLVPAKVE